MGRKARTSARNYIRKYETIVLHHVPDFDRNRAPEYRRGLAKRMECSVLTARVDPRSQIVQELAIILPARPGSVEFCGVDTSHLCLDARADQIQRKFARRDLPDGK